MHAATDIRTWSCNAVLTEAADKITGTQASQVKLIWDPAARAVLALTSSDSDPANKSYYGDAKLHLLAADGSADALVSMKVPALAVTHPVMVWHPHCLSERDPSACKTWLRSPARQWGGRCQTALLFDNCDHLHCL